VCSPPQGPTRTQQGRAGRTRRLAVGGQPSPQPWQVEGGKMETYPLLELLVDSIQCVLDCDALQIPRGNFKAQWEVESNLLDLWVAQWQLQESRIFDSCR
jgi:hypothetical protein